MTNEHFKNKYLKYKNKYYDLVNKKYSLKNNKHKIAGGTALEIAGGFTGILLIIAIIIYFVNYKEEKIEPIPLSSEIVSNTVFRETETATPAVAERKKEDAAPTPAAEARREPKAQTDAKARREPKAEEEKTRREAKAQTDAKAAEVLGLAVALFQK